MKNSRLSINDDLGTLLISGHQILGGIIGLFFIISTFEFHVAYYISVFLLLFSIVAGYLLASPFKNIFLSQLNYIFQIFSLYIYDIGAFSFDLPLSVLFRYDFENVILNFDFFLSTNLDIYSSYFDTTILGINTTSLIILWFISSDSGIDTELLNYDMPE